MKLHVKYLQVLLSLSMTTGLSAQQTGKIANGFNTANYPEVSFVYHSYNPDVLDKSDFWYLKEAGSDKEFSIEVLPTVVDSLPQTTLFLWEDMAHNGYEQFDFTQKVLTGFFNKVNASASDRFAISAFNRRRNTSSSLINVTDGFLKDKSQIVSAIQGYKHSKDYFKDFPNRSDMYTAIREGLELLAPLKGPKAIVVFTSGYSMRNSGSDSEAQVLMQAQRLHIPVYIFQYYYKSGIAPESEGFANSTFGSFNSYMDITNAETALINLYPEISKRYQGHDYKVSFIADAKRGAEAHMISFSVRGYETQEQLLPPQQLLPPSYTFKTWVAAHPWWVAMFIILLMALIVGSIIYIHKTRKKAAENRQQLADLEQRRIQDQKETTEQYQRDLENKIRQELESHQKHVEEERMSHLMEMKNLIPRLKYCDGNSSYVYEIHKPNTLIGRGQDNDLILSDKRVSWHHAKIVFNGSNFEIFDLYSTNKVIVNGQFTDRAVLKSGDIIELGKVLISFVY